ncbi:MAG: ABC transporter substrate-binding protein [Thermoanaerobaculia bacterium]|nr:ABC transporter substrate-binding protein [Thermoanaerobaculia bacterium]
MLGVLLDYTGPLGGHGEPTEAGIRLAVAQVNQAGGVLGHPVSLRIADGRTEPETAIAEAENLVSQGVHAIIGPSGSAATMAVARTVSGSERIATVSPSATSPELTTVSDEGFLFRTAISDSAQGDTLAKLAGRAGISHIAVAYQPDSYGLGLLRTFDESFDGQLTTLEVGSVGSYPRQLREAARNGARALAVFTYLGAAETLLLEATAEGLFPQYFLADAVATGDLHLVIEPEHFGAMLGTGPGGSDPEHAGSRVVAQEMKEAFGHLPRSAALSAYDATVCLCLAAEQARSTDREAIRNALHHVCGGDGRRIAAGSAGVLEALGAIRQGESIDYDGAASDVDWNEAGDVTDGFVGVYRYSKDGAVLQERIRFSRP